jgi:hypothetical protein
MKKGYLLLIAFCFAGTGLLKAQDVEYYKEEKSFGVVTDTAAQQWVRPESNFTAPASRFNYRLSAGTMMWGGAHRGMATYMAPEVGYRVSNRFTLSTGVMMFNSTMPLMYAGDRSAPGMRTNSAIMYASGSYMLNDRVILSGMAFQDMNSLAGRGNPSVNPQAQIRGMAVSAEYKISEHFSIGAGFSTRTGGMSPYNSFQNPSFNRMGGMFW